MKACRSPRGNLGTWLGRRAWAIWALLGAGAHAKALPIAPQASLVAGQQAELLAGDPGTDDSFGVSVGVLGDIAVVGAYSDNGSGTDSGAAYCFERSGSDWVQTQKFYGSTTNASDLFGRSVAIADTPFGVTALVGAYLDDPSGVSAAGAASAFVPGPNGWTQLLPRLTAENPQGMPDLGTNDRFGFSVDLGGRWAVVGAYFDDHGGMTDAGSAYVFLRQDPNQTQLDPTDDVYASHQKLTASDAGASDQFGVSVAIDGDRIVVGANLWDSLSAGNVGAAYVFVRTDPQGTPSDSTDDVWIEQQLLSIGSLSDEFGRSVDVSGDTVVCSAWRDDQAASNAGAVYAFEWNAGLQFWLFQQKLTVTGASSGDGLGEEGLSLDDARLAVGARYANPVGNDSGAVSVFERTGTLWTERTQLVTCDWAGGDYLGFDVALDGHTLISGAFTHNEIASNQGAAYVHVLSEGNFTPYCFGDGAGTPCPCTNDSASGRDQGCQNSAGLGGRISLWGSDSVSADDLRVAACNLIPANPALLFAGTTSLGSGFTFGDGLRCAGVGVVRIQTLVPSIIGEIVWGPGISAQGGWSAGDIRYVQAWYRDPIGSPCPMSPGFNLTNAWEIQFTP